MPHKVCKLFRAGELNVLSFVFVSPCVPFLCVTTIATDPIAAFTTLQKLITARLQHYQSIAIDYSITQTITVRLPYNYSSITVVLQFYYHSTATLLLHQYYSTITVASRFRVSNIDSRFASRHLVYEFNSVHHARGTVYHFYIIFITCSHLSSVSRMY